jgi:hypothetical protein
VSQHLLLSLPPVPRIPAPTAGESLLIDEIVQLLEKCPQVHFDRGEDLVRVLPATPEGFEVVIEQVWEDHYSVSYGGWHEDFHTLEEALTCFFMGMSNRCRLKVQTKEGNPFRWTVENWIEPSWRERSTKAGWSRRFLTPTVTTYLQNDLLPEGDLRVLLDKLVAHA